MIKLLGSIFSIPSILGVEAILVVTLGPLVGKEEFEADEALRTKRHIQ